jgi:osmoprotectant transport system ATP-binding protein
MVVEFDNVTVNRTGGRIVLDAFNLSIDAGEVIAVVGRSGAGKTTILKLVNRLLLPTAGVVRVEGRETQGWDGIELRRRVGYVFQDVGLFPHMSIEENVGIVPRLQHWPPERMHARTLELLALVGLPPEIYAARRPRELSGGERQRVGVARALAIDPPILLMDEPFGALDPVTRAEVRGQFARIQRELGTTVILVTHDMAEAFVLGTRVGVLHEGKLIACDRPVRVARSTDPRVRAFLDTLPAMPPTDQPDA